MAASSRCLVNPSDPYNSQLKVKREVTAVVKLQTKSGEMEGSR